MARGSNQAFQGSTQALNNSTNDATQANAAYGTLFPALEGEVTNPQGMNPADLSAARTEATQGAGGTQAAAVGAGALNAARTGNPGSARAAIASSSRGAGAQESKNILGVRNQNTKLKEQQQQAGLAGLEGVYSTGVSGSNAALGENAANVNANTNAANESWNWARTLLDPELEGGVTVNT